MHTISKSFAKTLSKVSSTYRVGAETTSHFARHYLEALDCPRALTVWLMFSNNEHQQLVELGCDPNHYSGLEQFRDAYAATLLFAKSEFLSLKVDKEAAALEKAAKFEAQCKQTNRRFLRLSGDPEFTGPNVALLHATRRKIAQILGRYDPLEVIDGANWGPGVTNFVKGVWASRVNKFQFETGITRDLYSSWFLENFGIPVIRDGGRALGAPYHLWQEHLERTPGFPTFEIGSVTVTVPKNAKIKRVIRVEPGLNLWIQKGQGLAIRKRLRAWGVNLNDQSRNQKLSKMAHKANLTTADFSSASDSIAREPIRELLPPDWFSALDAARSHYSMQDGLVSKMDMFSSMGNGFTFELESLVFFAAALAVCEYLNTGTSNVSVYGDDVILPSSCFALFSSYTKFLGFTVNDEKSFADGPFRESCGAHWYEGFDVKPIYLKEVLSTPETVYKLANAVRGLAHARNASYGCDARFKPTFDYLLRVVPRDLRFRIPYGYGEGGFISNFDETCPSRAVGGIEGYLTYHATYPAVKQANENIGMLLDRLSSIKGTPAFLSFKTDAMRSVEATDAKVPAGLLARFFICEFTQRWIDANITNEKASGNSYALRGRTKIVVRRLFVNQWYDLGPWL